MGKNREIINLIKLGLKEKGMSRKELADKIGCTPRTLYYWFAENRSISVDMADKALMILGKEAKVGNKEERIRK